MKAHVLAAVVAALIVVHSGVSAQPSRSRPTFSASPASGTAPLTVTFTGNYFGTGYSVDYGDGSLGPKRVCSFNCTAAQNSVSLRHTYAAAGTFTATLTDSSGGKATATVSAEP